MKFQTIGRRRQNNRLFPNVLYSATRIGEVVCDSLRKIACSSVRLSVPEGYQKITRYQMIFFKLCLLIKHNKIQIKFEFHFDRIINTKFTAISSCLDEFELFEFGLLVSCYAYVSIDIKYNTT